MVLGIAHDDDAASAGFDFVALGDAFGGVVGALGVKIGTDFADDGADVVLREDDHGIDIGEGGENFGALGFRHDRAAFAFQCADRSVGVDGNNELASKCAGSVEIANVADVEDVETAVGEGDAISGVAPGRDAALQVVTGKNLRMEWGGQ